MTEIRVTAAIDLTWFTSDDLEALYEAVKIELYRRTTLDPPSPITKDDEVEVVDLGSSDGMGWSLTRKAPRA